MKSSVEIRPIRADEVDEAVRLADETFRDSEQTSMASAFPYVFSKQMTGQSYAAFAEGKIVSFLGLVPAMIHINQARLKVFSLGSVCTHPAYRGNGLASAVLKKVSQHVNQAGASLLLVSGNRSLYTRADCHPFGEILRYTANPDFARQWLEHHPLSDLHIRECKPTDCLNLAEVSASRAVRYEQSVWDLASLIHAESYASCLKLHHKVLVAEKNGHITGLLVVGTPYRQEQTQQPIAVEWAGEADVVVTMMAQAIQDYGLQRLEIPVPWHEQELIDLLRPLNMNKEKNVGTVHIVDAERLIRQLRPYLEKKDRDTSNRMAVRSLEKGLTQVTWDDHTLVMNAHEWISLIFDPDPKPGSLTTPFQSLLPIPFPYTGGLNYV